MNEFLEKFLKTADEHGLMCAVGKYLGIGAVIQLPFSQSSCDTQITELDLSIRSVNCLLRANLRTVDKVIDAICGNALFGIRNLGKKSAAEIRTNICEFGYARLSERGKKQFVQNLAELNADKVKIV